MKFFTKIVLAAFILFQFSSMILYVINERNETTIAFNITEEEEHHKHTKNNFAEVVFDESMLCDFLFQNNASNTFDFYLLKDYSLTLMAFFPPPEQV